MNLAKNVFAAIVVGLVVANTTVGCIIPVYHEHHHHYYHHHHYD